MPKTGGIADKLGNRYEARWAAKQALLVLAGQLHSVQVEGIGDDEPGVDVWVVPEDPGVREGHQCKLRNGVQGKWTLGALDNAGVLGHLKAQLTDAPDKRYVLVSADRAPVLEDLAETARLSSRGVRAFVEEVQATQGRRKDFEEFCQRLDLNADEDQDQRLAFDLLLRTDTKGRDDSSQTRREDRELAERWVAGDGDVVLSVLERWLLKDENLRRPIQAPEIAEYLSGHGHEPRIIAHDARLWPALRELQADFKEFLQHHLAGDTLIRRKEADDLHSSLMSDDAPQVHIVHGKPGIGKSGVLLDLVRRLDGDQVPYLPMRLDRQIPRDSPRTFGREVLNLPESPAHCLEALAADRPAVLIVDQLDAIRWTSSHSAQAWETTRKVLVEAQRSEQLLHVVVCCRTFDLQNDPQIDAWKKQLSSPGIYEVGKLEIDTVKECLEDAGQDPATFIPRQLELLATVQHLKTWLEIAAESPDSRRFESSYELMDRFWETREDLLRQQRIDAAGTLKLLDEIVDYMEREGVQAAPEAVAAAPTGQLRALCRVGILHTSGGQILFAHQSYLDHWIARRLVKEILTAQRSVRDWLGDRSRQELYRREQLRLVLGRLRSQHRQRYMQEIQELLEDDQVRFHLKHLILLFLSLGEQVEPMSSEVDLILELLDDQDWRVHVLDLVVTSSPWFRALDDRGVIEGWLRGRPSEIEDATRLMRIARKTEGDRVAALLPLLIGGGEDGCHRAQSILGYEPDKDTDALFQQRLRLAEMGHGPDHVFWKRLGENHPDRLTELLRVQLLRRLADFLATSDPPYCHQPESGWHQLATADLAGADADQLGHAWQALPTALNRLLEHDPEELPRSSCVETGHFGFGWIQPTYSLLVKIATRLLKTDWRAAVRVIERYPTLAGQAALLDSVKETEPEPALADWILRWLMDEPKRLELRRRQTDSRWLLSGAAIEHLTAWCSEEMLVEFSMFLIEYREPDLLEDYRWRHERLMEELERPDPENRHPVLEATRSVAGKTPHHLLRYVDTDRMEAGRRRLVRRKLGEWERKFGSPEKVDSPRVVKVASPFEGRDMTKLSDDAWLELMCNAGRRHKERFSMRRGRLEYSTLEGYLPELGQAAHAQPERFAQLALKIPKAIPTAALRRILSSLSNEKPPEGSSVSKESWTPASFDSVRAVLELRRAREEGDLVDAYCRVATAYPEHRWTEPIRETICRIAREAPGSPSIDGQENDRDWTRSPQDLISKSLNCLAGSAAIAIGTQLLSFPADLDLFEQSIRSLCRNPNPAVKTAALRAVRCIPSENEDRILSLLFEACRDAPDAMLATPDALAILRYFGPRQPVRLLPLIDRMLNSEVDTVVTKGAAITTAIHLTTGQLEERYEACVEGSTPQRRGVAGIAAGWINESDHHEWCTRMTLKFADDHAEDVHEEINEQIHHWDLPLLAQSVDFLARFATTRSFRSDPSTLLSRLESHDDNILSFAPCLLAVGRTIAQDLASDVRDPTTHASSSLFYLIPLLLRLYEESSRPGHEDAHIECLDLWDLLLENRIEIAGELTTALDQAG